MNASETVKISKTAMTSEVMEVYADTKEVMLVDHPHTDCHKDAVDDLAHYFEKCNICVHCKQETFFENWRDFAEKAGETYRDVVFILSEGLVELCGLYRKKACGRSEGDSVGSERWRELVTQRQGEYIPCVVLDRLRTVYQNKLVQFRTHFVAFCDIHKYCDHGSSECFTFCDLVNSCDVDNHHEHVTLCDLCTGMNHDVGSCHKQGDPITFGDSEKHENYRSFFKYCSSFLDTKNTFIHCVSRDALKHLLGSEDHKSVNSLSVSSVLGRLGPSVSLRMNSAH